MIELCTAFSSQGYLLELFMKRNKERSAKGILLLFAILVGFMVSGQEQRQKPPLEFFGTATVTNNGISLIPSFSLGEPALLFDLKLRKGRFSFEPDMRFALEGKPWSFVFWFRYLAVEKKRFTLRVGAHPAMNFRTVDVSKDGVDQEIIQTRRYIAAEIAPNYRLTDKIYVGMYYLRGWGFDEGVKNTNFLVLNSSFNNLFITKEIYLNVSPQVYFLKTDNDTGYYAVAFLNLAKKNFPFSISSTLNKAIETEIVPEDDFTWNISLNFHF